MIAFFADNVSLFIIWAIIAGIIVANSVVIALNPRIDNLRDQRRLGLAMLLVDAILVWGMIILFIGDYHSSIFATYTLVITQAAIRFGMTGSIIAMASFAIGITAEWIYRYETLSVPFSAGGFTFWNTTMLLSALMVGMLIEGLKKARHQSEMLATERVQLLERRRLSHELHDSVLKSLQGIALEAHVLGKANLADATAVTERARYIEDVCQTMSREIREVVFELRTEDAQEGIGSKLGAVLARWSQKTDVKSEFSSIGEDTALSANVAYNLRRIVGEALTNIEKHANATRVKVTLSIDARQLVLGMADNGKGFDTQNNSFYTFTGQGKLGLTSMKERAELIGGKFEIHSSPAGTRITVTVPLISPEPNQEGRVAPDHGTHS